MKIYTNRKNEFGQTVLFGDTPIKFNSIGEADVKETVAAELVEKYKGWLTISKKEYVDQKVVESNNKIAEEFQKSLLQLKEKVESREATIKVKEEEIKSWKEETLKYKELYEKILSDFDNHKKVWSNEKTILELKATMAEKTVKELIEIAVEYDISSDKLDGKKKAEIIEIILSKVN